MQSQLLMDNATKFFFSAMLSGYAGGNTASTDPKYPGYKIYQNKRGPWQMTDMWTVTPNSTRSSGMTTITNNGLQIWFMQYSGWYEDVAIPVLKKALAKAYRERTFFGGRGPEYLEHESLAYRNPRTFLWSFVYFEGNEEIVDLRSGKTLGYHKYRGGWLLD